MIEFFTCIPNNNFHGITERNMIFDKLGYIRMDNNVKTNFKAREFRKIFVNANCSYVKLVLHKNFVNKYNAFNQVGLMYFEFIGEALPEVRKPNFEPKNEVVEFKIEDMDEKIQEKIKVLKQLQEEAVKIEDFDEAKKIKQNIENCIHTGRKLISLDTEKKLAVVNEDFDTASRLKLEMEAIKLKIKTVEEEKAEAKLLEEEKQAEEAKKEELRKKEEESHLKELEKMDKEK
jgi:centrosomal protein CEP104